MKIYIFKEKQKRFSHKNKNSSDTEFLRNYALAIVNWKAPV
jgi:hypothetical protein